MSKTKSKETTLTINFVGSDNSIGDRENMSKVIELLGAPDFAAKSELSGWNITAPNGKSIKISSIDIRDFICGAMFNATSEIVMKDTYFFNTYDNVAFIEKTFFDIGKDSNPHSSVGSIYGGNMEITTRGNNVTKTALDNLHKKNVLDVKDKIVVMKHVQNVEYTCRLKDVVSSECSV